MIVWIVMKNGRVDEVFDNFPAAEEHRKNLNRKWSLSDIIEKEVKSL